MSWERILLLVLAVNYFIGLFTALISYFLVEKNKFNSGDMIIILMMSQMGIFVPLILADIIKVDD